MQMQMFNAFKDVSTAASGSVRLNLLNEEYPDGMSCDEFYDSLEKPWNIRIKQLYKVGAQVSKFTGDRLSNASWRRKFFAMVHNQRMLVADKALGLSAALDTTKEDLNAVMRGLNYNAATYAALIRELERLYGGVEAEVTLAAAEIFKGGKIQLTALELVRAFQVKLAAYGTILDTHKKQEAEFSPNSQLYSVCVWRVERRTPHQS
jgi:hypothetical protein